MSRTVSPVLIAAFATACAALAYAATLPRSQAAQTPVPVPSPSPDAPAPPLLTVPDAPEPNPVAIERADLLFQSVGTLTKTTVTLRFRNTTKRILEGELAFPLPEGASVSGYALDVNGEMADAVPVPKDEARVIFETEARKGIDPGLVEQTAGNNFRTRIYPIPVGGTRTVRLSFTGEATTGATDTVTRLPLRWNQTVPLVNVRVQSDAPAMLSLGGTDREMVPDTTSGGSTKTLENVAINGDLSVRVQTAKSQAVQSGVMTESFTKPSGETETYFAVLQQTPALSVATPVVQTGRTVGILWDASLSRRTADIERELRFLETVAREKWRDTEVRVVVFRDTPEPGRTFRITNGDASELIAFLRAQPLDGGTAYRGAFEPNAGKLQHTPGYWLAFTDGLETLGKENGIESASPVFVINTDSRSNAVRLRALANTTGGDYVALSGDAEADAARAKTIGELPYSLLSATVDTGQVEGLTGERQPTKDTNAVALAGRLVSDTATLTLRYGYPGRGVAGAQTRTVTLTQPAEAAPSSGLVATVWAQRTAAALGAEPKQNRDALKRIGQEYGIVTPGTSLLILETLAQHLEYGIAPARNRKALYAQYVQAVEAQGVAKRREERDRLGEAITRWRKRVSYWDTQFKPGANFRYQASKQQEGSASAAGSGSGMGRRVSGAVPLPNDLPAPSRPAPTTGTGGGAGGFAAPAPVQDSDGAAREVRRMRVGGEVNALVGRSSSIAAKSKTGDADAEPTAFIAIKPWTPDAPYLKKIDAAPTPAAAYAVYLSERKPWLETPAYYFDCAEALHRKGTDALAVRVLTGIADLRLEDAALLRIVAHRLTQWNHTASAIPLWEQIADLRPEEPQSFRDLALALASRADAIAVKNPAGAVADYNRALVLLNKVAIGKWDRFEGISDIAVTEANRIIARAKRLPTDATAKLVVPLDTRLVRNLDCDLRVVMTWDADNTDMDLHIGEPTGEECFYSHNRTAIGGHLSDDFTQGYGPEEYFVRRGKSGTYTIQTNYFASREQKITGGTTVQATVFTDWGRPTEKQQSLSLRLTQNKETVTIGKVTLDKR